MADKWEDQWIRLAAAINKITGELDVGEAEAQQLLIEAGASVRSSALVGSHATRYTVPANGVAKS